MKYLLVAFATLFAMFWDELIITIVTMVIGKSVNHMFMISWIICSGIITSILVSYHVSIQYRLLTLILIFGAMLFSLQGYISQRHKHDDNI